MRSARGCREMSVKKITMTQYRLFSWGANSHGQLGHGDIADEELLEPREVDLTRTTDVHPKNIVKIVGGAGHTLLLDDAGRLFSCGWNDKGQAGVSESSSRFRRLQGLEGEKIVDVACGWDSSMALTEDGRVFTWGSNSHGQLGLKQVAVGLKLDRPSRVQLDIPVRRISMGLRHSAVVTRDARVFASGAAAKGQLGVDLRGAKCSEQFVEVPQIEKAKEVACGQHHTIIATENNKIFAWGDNKHGQLGVDPSVERLSSTPIEIQNFEGSIRINKLYCGWTHSAILTDTKRILCWGRTSYGQLGRGETLATGETWKADTPKLSANIDQFSVGSEHNIALTDEKAIVSWGWNEHGNCGNKSTEDVFAPTTIPLVGVDGILIGTGAGHSFAVVKRDI